MAGTKMTICACMGAMYGEPYCYCTMVSRGLPLNTIARNAENERSKKELAALFGPGGMWYRAPLPKMPANARIVKSRNQREGFYAGFCGKHAHCRMRYTRKWHHTETQTAREALERKRLRKASYANQEPTTSPSVQTNSLTGKCFWHVAQYVAP